MDSEEKQYYYNQYNDNLDQTRLVDSYEESISSNAKEVAATTRSDFDLLANGCSKYGNHRLMISCEFKRAPVITTIGTTRQLRPILSSESVVNDLIPDPTNAKRYTKIGSVENNIIIWAKGEGDEI